MAANGSINFTNKQLIVSSLCNHFSLEPQTFLGGVKENDIKSLYSNILKSSGKDSSATTHNDEVTKWVEFAESFPADSKACFDVLKKLNEELSQKSVLLGIGLRPSVADVVVFSTVHSFVAGLPNSDREKLPHILRWMDYIQRKEDFGELFGNIMVEKAGFERQLLGAKTAAKMEVELNAKKTSSGSTNVHKSEADSNLKTRGTVNDKGKKGYMQDKKQSVESEAVGKDREKKSTGDKEATQEKKKSSETDAVEKDKELSVNLLNIQVGLIRKAWKHPSADSLLVEEIDIGEAKLRQVVSGLAKYCNPDQLMNRRVVLITNVKPGKLRDVMSEGLVLCASNEDHTIVEPLLPPEGAKAGERVSFSGFDGKPEDVLNPKKKQLEKITPNLFTDEKGVATFKGVPFMTSAGPCTSSIPKASIK